MISAKFVQGGDGYLTWWVSVGANLTFHINTLEEYYCGGLFLTTGNGVTDGSFGLYTLMIIMAILGDHWCTQEAVKGGGFFLKWNHILYEICYLMYFCTFLACFKMILSKPESNKKGEDVVLT